MAFVKEEAFPKMEEIVHYHQQGTRFSIHVDKTDGLLSAGANGVQLTWMQTGLPDAGKGGVVVAPAGIVPVIVTTSFGSLSCAHTWNETGTPAVAISVVPQTGDVKKGGVFPWYV